MQIIPISTLLSLMTKYRIIKRKSWCFLPTFFILNKTKYPKKTTDVKTIKNVLFRSWGQSEYEKLKADAIIRANFHLNPDELQVPPLDLH